MDLSPLLEIPDQTVYGLFNDNLKVCYLGFSTNTLDALVRNLRQLKYSNKELKEFEFRVIEIVTAPTLLRLKYQFHSQEYSNNGWTLMRSFRAIEYKLHKEFIQIGNDNNHKRYYWRVFLRSRGRRNVTVGIFDSYTEMDRFVTEYYPSNKVIYNIVTAQNELTGLYDN